MSLQTSSVDARTTEANLPSLSAGAAAPAGAAGAGLADGAAGASEDGPGTLSSSRRGLTPVSHEMTRRRMSPPQPRDAPRPLIGKPRRSSTFSLSRPSSHRMTSPPSSRTLRPAVPVLDCFEQTLRPGVSEGAAHDDGDRRDDLP